jgi:hypothetical protein
MSFFVNNTLNANYSLSGLGNISPQGIPENSSNVRINYLKLYLLLK